MKTKHLLPALLLACGVAFSEEATPATTVTTTTVTTTTRTAPAERKASARKTEPARAAWSWGRASGSLCDSTACRPVRFAWSTAPGG